MELVPTFLPEKTGEGYEACNRTTDVRRGGYSSMELVSPFDINRLDQISIYVFA